MLKFIFELIKCIFVFVYLVPALAAMTVVLIIQWSFRKIERLIEWPLEVINWQYAKAYVVYYLKTKFKVEYV